MVLHAGQTHVRLIWLKICKPITNQFAWAVLASCVVLCFTFPHVSNPSMVFISSQQVITLTFLFILVALNTVRTCCLRGLAILRMLRCKKTDYMYPALKQIRLYV